MDTSPVERLTDKQRAVLRLCYENLAIKEIARQLDITPDAVNERLRDARRVLGVSRSMEAARILAAQDGYKRSVDTANGVDRAADPPHGTPQKQPGVSVAVAADRYRFSALQRLGIILMMAVGFVALSGSVVMGAYALTYLFRAEKISIAEKPYRR